MRSALLGVCASALALFALPAWAAPLTSPLTAEQAACNEIQLERLSRRIVVREGSSGFFNPTLFLWRSGPGGGSYAGLAVTDGVRGGQGRFFRSETQLALDLVTAAVGDPLNPTRRLMPRATLVRRDQGSNLVTSNYLNVTMALETMAVDPYLAKIPITVNNLAPGTTGATGTTSAAGGGITADDLTSSCDSLLTPFDERVFTILSRTLRASLCAFVNEDRASCGFDGTSFNITLFRGPDPQTYRANVYSYSEVCLDTGPCIFEVLDKTGLEFKMSWDAQGRLTMGQVAVLPTCPTPGALPCVNGAGYPLFVLPPLWAGHAHQGSHVIGSAPRVGNDEPLGPLRPSAAIDWQALLAGSAWN